VVNLRHVAQIEPYFNQTLVIRVRDEAGTRLPVSRRRARELRDRLGMTSNGR
jgi:DNA-binding LytR/AlgR family response regulator